MKPQLKTLLFATVLSAPLAFAAPHVQHGNAGDHGNGGGRGNAGNHGNGGGYGNAGGRGNSQGAAHANYHAINAVCGHAASAAHSALGVDCGGGIFLRRDPRTGINSYSQAGLDVAPVAAAQPSGTRQPRTGPQASPNRTGSTAIDLGDRRDEHGSSSHH